MRTRQKRVATDTWRSLGCRTTPLEHWNTGAKENQQLNPGGPSNRQKSLVMTLSSSYPTLGTQCSFHNPTHSTLIYLPHTILSLRLYPTPSYQQSDSRTRTIFFRLQQKYIEVPGTVSVGVKDVYKLYSENIPPGTKHSALSQHQVGAIVPKLFPNIKVVRKKMVMCMKAFVLISLKTKTAI